MNVKLEEQQLKQVLDTIQTPPIDDLHDNVMKRLNQQTRFKRHQGFKVALTTCLCLFLSVNFLAAASPDFKNLLSLIGYQVELYLQPINLVSESDGIKLEVLGAMNDDDSTIIYLTLQDLTKDRIDETLDIYNFTLSGARVLNMRVIDYNEETHTATLQLQGHDGKNINGKNVYFGIQSFLSDKVFYDDFIPSLDLSLFASQAAESITLKEGDSSGGSGLMGLENRSNIKVLKPNQLNLTLPELDFITISNVGYIDNKLHIQVKYRDNSIDDHGYFYFVDESGEEVDISSGSISFGVNENNETQYGTNMEEYIFDITLEQLESLQLKGDFVTANQYTEGDWRVKFKLESVKDFFKQKMNLKVKDSTITNLSISPLGLTLEATNPIELTDLSASLTLQNGEIIDLSHASSVSVQEDFQIKFVLSTPIDVEDIQSITINGDVISIN